MKTSTVALIVSMDCGCPQLVDTLHDEGEIEYLSSAMNSGETNPLREIYLRREREENEQNEFGDYVEELLSQPFVNPDIQRNAVQWLKSRIKIEQFQKTEREAAEVISRYAYKIFKDDPTLSDFVLMSQTSQVRIRVFILPETEIALSG